MNSIGASPIKRARRTEADIERIETAIYVTLDEDHPQTVRGLFYQLVSQGVVPKTEAAYKGLVGRLCVRMRRAGVLPYDWLADNTRWMRKPTTHTGLQAALQRTAEVYRRAVWADMPVYVEVWLEKDALAGAIASRHARSAAHPSSSRRCSAVAKRAAIRRPLLALRLSRRRDGSRRVAAGRPSGAAPPPSPPPPHAARPRGATLGAEG